MTDPTPDPSLHLHEPPAVLPVWPAEPPMVQPVEPIPPPGPHIGWALLWFIGFFAFQIILGIGLGAGIIILMIARDGREALRDGPKAIFAESWSFLIIFIGSTAGNLLYALAAAGVMLRERFRRALALRGVHPLHVGFILLLAPVMLLTAGECGNWAREVLPDLELNDEAYRELAKSVFPLVLFAGCVLPGVGEEILFRGFLGRGLVARHGFLLGLLFSSVLFGLAHLNPPQVVATGLLGCGFHSIFLSSKSLIAPMLAHALNNGLAFGLMKFGEELKLATPGVTDDGHMPPLLALAALGATIGLLVLFYHVRARWILPDGSLWQPGYLTAEMPPAELGASVRLNPPPLWAIGLALATYGTFVGVFGWKLAG